ncbi:MAG: ATP-binding protein [Bacteroidota bacterium]
MHDWVVTLHFEIIQLFSVLIIAKTEGIFLPYWVLVSLLVLFATFLIIWYFSSVSKMGKSTIKEKQAKSDERYNVAGSLPEPGSLLSEDESDVQSLDHLPSLSEKYNDAIAYKQQSKHEKIIPDIVFECDQQGKLYYIDQLGYEILDLSEQKIQKGINLLDIVHAEDRKKLQFRLANNQQSINSPENGYRFRTHRGVSVTFNVYLFPFKDKNNLSRFKGFLTDVSRKKRSENILEMLHDIVSHIDIGLSVFKAENLKDSGSFRLEMANIAAGQMMRFLNEKNIGKSIDEISPLMRQLELHDVFFNVLHTSKFQEIEELLYQPDNHYIKKYFKVRVFPLPLNRVAMLMEDITFKRDTETTLKMTKFALESAGDIILWMDEKARFTYVNKTAEKKYGYTEKQLLAMGLPDVDTRISMMHWYELTQILDSKPSLNMESINKTNENVTFPVEISINKFIFDGKRKYFAFVRDISERKRNDELEQKIQIARKSAAIKQQFLANMSHEIRTPMTGIMGMTSLLQKSNLNMAQLEYVNNIRISSENLLNIINDVLDLSKIEAGKMELKPTKFNLRKFIDQVTEFFQHKIDAKGLSFKTSISSHIPKHIIADQNRLKQLLNNLLSNAIKFTDQGGITVHFLLKEKNDKKMILACKVRDTGMGISEENQKHIFEKYTQIETSLVKKFEGTGLGLAICRELAGLMGGEISVKSKINEGSIFEFSFRAEYDETEQTPEINPVAIDLQELDLNILHVEDKLLNQKVVAYILMNAGANVDFAKNGAEAIKMYKPGRYDLILMDIHMPVMDGITAHKKLSELYGEQLCPVIGLSANALEGDAQKFMELGLNDYIMKPFKPEVLYEKINQWCNPAK